MKSRKSKRGGKRPGAGRPGPKGPRTQIAVSTRMAAVLASYAETEGITMREAAERAIWRLTNT